MILQLYVRNLHSAYICAENPLFKRLECRRGQCGEAIVQYSTVTNFNTRLIRQKLAREIWCNLIFPASLQSATRRDDDGNAASITVGLLNHYPRPLLETTWASVVNINRKTHWRHTVKNDVIEKVCVFRLFFLCVCFGVWCGVWWWWWGSEWVFECLTEWADWSVCAEEGARCRSIQLIVPWHICLLN